MNSPRLWCSLLALCGLLAASSGEASPIAHWTFDSTADPWHDSAGGNHGVPVGSPGQTAGPIGAYALQLDGSTSYLNVGSGAAFDTQSYTVSAWLQPTATSGWRTAVGSWDNPYWMHFGLDDQRRFSNYVRTNAGQLGVTDPAQVPVGNTDWYHVAAVVDAETRTQSLWVNGQLKASVGQGGWTSTNVPGANDVFLGVKDAAGGNKWGGGMDDVAIWNRPLSGSEIGSLYAWQSTEAVNASQWTAEYAPQGALGNWGWRGLAGVEGYVSTVVQENKDFSWFGVQLQGTTQVDAITIDQSDHAARRTLENIRVYTSPTQYQDFTLGDTRAPQTIDLGSVDTGYVLVKVLSQYTGYSDPNTGIDSLVVTTSGRTLNDRNVNLGIAPSATGLLDPGALPVIRATDGVAFSQRDTNNGLYDHDYATFFARNAGQDTLTVQYDEPQWIASIGLAMATQSVLRDLPKYVTLLHDEGEEDIWLSGLEDRMPYGRYRLDRPVATSFLTLQFPDGADTTAWYLGGDINYGVVEFQAFVPEPSTGAMLLLALVGAALCGGRRKRWGW